MSNTFWGTKASLTSAQAGSLQPTVILSPVDASTLEELLGHVALQKLQRQLVRCDSLEALWYLMLPDLHSVSGMDFTEKQF